MPTNDHSSKNTTPLLTATEIRRFQSDGFICIENVFSNEEIENFRESVRSPEIEAALKKRNADENTVHLIPLTTRNEVFKDLACDVRITQRIAQLIGDDIQLSNSKLAVKPITPGAGEFKWHQDFAYYTSTNFDLLTVSVALDDSTPDNGGMYAVEGSHSLGLLDHTEKGWMTGACVESKYWQDEPDKIKPLMSKAGGITIHHCLTLHGSPVNKTGMPRRLVIFQYRAGHCVQLADHTWEDSGYQVYGEPKGTVKCASFDAILPKNRGWEQYCGEPHGSAYNQIGPKAREWNAHRDATSGQIKK